LNTDFFSRALSRSLTTTEPIKPHDKYREINQEILRTLRLERQNTISYVDNTLKSVPGNVTRDKIEDEIHAAALKWSDKGFAEVGPTGNYEYFFIDSPVGGTRTYQRRDLKFGNEQIVCSCNFNYEELGPMSLSTDEKYAVRVVSQPLTNNTCQRILVRDIDASVDFQISILNRREDSYIPRIHNVEFGPTIDGTSERLYSLFITTCDELGRPNAVHGCIVSGEERSHSKSHLIFVDDDAAHFVDVQRTKGCEYVAIHSTSKSSNEIRLVGGDFRPILVRRRQDQVQYYIDCGVDKDVVIMALKNTSCALQKGTFESGDTGHFQIELGQEFSVFEATIGDMPLEESFGKKILFDQQQHEEETGKSIYFIEDMDLFDSKIVFYERSHVDGFQRMRVWDRREKREAIIPFPLCGDEERFVLSSTGNMNYFSKCFQFIAESPILPPKCFRYDFKTRKIMKESETPNNDDKDDPTTRFHRILVDSSNEKKCPLTIVQKTEAALSGKPIILVGYGCYGQNQNLQFEPSIIPLVNRGFAIVSTLGISIFVILYSFSDFYFGRPFAMGVVAGSLVINGTSLELDKTKFGA
jgi:protease II